MRRAAGFDLSAGMIARARELAAGLDNVEFREGDVTEPLPFADGEFTALLCSTAFHHFPDQHHVLAEMYRVLSSGGRLVIADGNRRHPAVFVSDLVLRGLQRSHAGLRSPARLMRDLIAAGFASAAYCTVHARTYAFVRAEKAPS